MNVRSVVPVLLIGLLLTACTTAPRTEIERQQLVQNAEQTLERFRLSNPAIRTQVEEAYGYAVFPSVGKGGAGLGGAYGRGVVFEQGRPVGYCDLSQGTVGFQLGGQRYSELILFENRQTLERFKSGEFAFSAAASAVAAEAGTAAVARYTDGVAVYTLGEMGLMYEASIGGQKFSYIPM